MRLKIIFLEKLMEKIWTEMYDAAKAVLNGRQINGYVSCGEVSAAVLSKSGRIYTGVCIDTCSGLGVCAERKTAKVARSPNMQKMPNQTE